MFCVFNGKGEIVAFHDYVDVVEEYVDHIKMHHKDAELHIGKLKKKKANSVRYADLYLVRYADTYVQQGYLEYLSYFSDQDLYDLKYAKEVLLRLLEGKNFDKKDKKYVERVIYILDEELQNDKEYTPTIDELRRFKMHYESYLYNTGCY